ncbi:MAG: hypothetical protein JWM31_2049 [Solirubrobacterales bacterium]|nr:hypothetical protein [Solirubrobacterales bacterium]
MSDAFPRWPEPWTEDHLLEDDHEIAASEAIVFRAAQRDDRQVLMAIAWPEGTRYLMVEPVGMDVPQSFRIGELSEDPEVARQVEGMWSQALMLAKKLLDGDIASITEAVEAQLAGEDPEGEAGGGRRRPWRRG